MLYSEEEKAVIDRALQIIESKLTVKGAALTSPELAADFCRLHLATLEHELFAIILLDYQNRFIKYVELFRGSIASAAVYPREVVKEALTVNAASCLLLHNHPSGDATPSEADIKNNETITSCTRIGRHTGARSHYCWWSYDDQLCRKRAFIARNTLRSKDNGNQRQVCNQRR